MSASLDFTIRALLPFRAASSHRFFVLPKIKELHKISSWKKICDKYPDFVCDGVLACFYISTEKQKNTTCVPSLFTEAPQRGAEHTEKTSAVGALGAGRGAGGRRPEMAAVIIQLKLASVPCSI